MRSLVVLALVALMGSLALVPATGVDTSVVSSDASLPLDEKVGAGLANVHSIILEAEQNMDSMDAEDRDMMQPQQQEEEAAQPVSFLETSTDVDAESEMEESFGLDADNAPDALFLESDSDAHVTMDSSAASQHVIAEAQTLPRSAEDGGVIVSQSSNDAANAHAQDRDPIRTQQDELNDVLKEYGMIEAHAQSESTVDADAEAESEAEMVADADADAELDIEADAEAEDMLEAELDEALASDSEFESEFDSEADSESESEEGEGEGEDGASALLESESGEPQVSITKCGKKIIWERNQEPQPAAAKEGETAAPVDNNNKETQNEQTKQ